MQGRRSCRASSSGLRSGKIAGRGNRPSGPASIRARSSSTGRRRGDRHGRDGAQAAGLRRSRQQPWRAAGGRAVSATPPDPVSGRGGWWKMVAFARGAGRVEPAQGHGSSGFSGVFGEMGRGRSWWRGVVPFAGESAARGPDPTGGVTPPGRGVGDGRGRGSARSPCRSSSRLAGAREGEVAGHPYPLRRDRTNPDSRIANDDSPFANQDLPGNSEKVDGLLRSRGGGGVRRFHSPARAGRPWGGGAGDSSSCRSTRAPRRASGGIARQAASPKGTELAQGGVRLARGGMPDWHGGPRSVEARRQPRAARAVPRSAVSASGRRRRAAAATAIPSRQGARAERPAAAVPTNLAHCCGVHLLPRRSDPSLGWLEWGSRSHHRGGGAAIPKGRPAS